MKRIAAFFKNNWSWMVPLTVVCAIVAAYFTWDKAGAFVDELWKMLRSGDEERIARYFSGFGVWGPLAIIMLMTLQMFLLVFPTWLPMIIAMLAYGPFWGCLISVAAVLTASTLGYFIGSKLGEQAKDRLIKPEQYQKLHGFMERFGFGAVVLFRISPFLSNDAISLVAGMMKMGFGRYMAATLTGILPLIAAIAYFGRDTQTLKNGLYWIGGAGCVIYVIYIWLNKRKKPGRASP